MSVAVRDKGLGLGVQYKMLGLRMVLEIILVEIVIECQEMFSHVFSHQDRKTEYCLDLGSVKVVWLGTKRIQLTNRFKLHKLSAITVSRSLWPQSFGSRFKRVFPYSVHIRSRGSGHDVLRFC